MKTATIEVNGEALAVHVEADGSFRDSSGRAVSPSECRWLAPKHTVIYGLALNFADHARELNFAELPEGTHTIHQESVFGGGAP